MPDLSNVWKEAHRPAEKLVLVWLLDTYGGDDLHAVTDLRRITLATALDKGRVLNSLEALDARGLITMVNDPDMPDGFAFYFGPAPGPKR